LNQAHAFALGEDPTTVERLRAVQPAEHDDEPTQVEREPRRRRLRFVAQEHLPVAQFACAVATTAAALVYVLTLFFK
jgi:hypothetical protein